MKIVSDSVRLVAAYHAAAWTRSKTRIARVPTGPGVYLWKDDAERVLYVGKATNLRQRLRSYLGRGDDRPLVHLLMRRAADVDVITTDTPEAALLLENTLIKKERPPYNLRLKDDKSYLLVRVDRKHPFPRLRLVRRVKKDGATYIGPFASAKAVRGTLRFLRTLYPLRTCSDRELAERTRACLYHQIGRCAAPCIDAITPEAYGQLLDDALALLRGRDDGTLDRLRHGMLDASAALDFERAARLRDRLQALEGVIERRETVRADGRDRDVIAVAAAGGTAVIGLVYVRDGHVVATRALPQRTSLGRRDVITAFLAQAYAKGKIVPPEILVEEEPVDAEGLEGVLRAIAGRQTKIRKPQRGGDRDLVTMAARHAAEALEEHGVRAREAQSALRRIAELLELAAPPERIEAFDLSHLGGSEPVAGMSVLIGGVPETSAYRHFAVRDAAGGDDYGGMDEIIGRRFARGRGLGDLPDLVLIDGGRGQLEAARRAVQALGHADVPMIGLAKARREAGKEDERIIRPDLEEPLILDETDAALRILVRARDEAHRFAGRYQRQRRSQALVKGVLDDVPGIGAKRRRQLLERFGSVAGIKRASFEDLAAMPGIGERRAREIRERLS